MTQALYAHMNNKTIKKAILLYTYFKWVNFMISDLHLNNGIFFKRENLVIYSFLFW
jgi:hypothetical protein